MLTRSSHENATSDRSYARVKRSAIELASLPGNGEDHLKCPNVMLNTSKEGASEAVRRDPLARGRI